MARIDDNKVEILMDILLEKAITGALSNDASLAVLALSRHKPALKSVSQPFKADMSGDNLSERAEKVLNHISDGIVTPDAGVEILRALEIAGVVSEESTGGFEIVEIHGGVNCPPDMEMEVIEGDSTGGENADGTDIFA